MLGGGSNMLFTRDVEVAAKVAIAGRQIVHEDDRHVVVEFGAGEVWHECVAWAVQQGWGGIENLALIPGNIGAAPIQNIGAYGVELTSVFEQLRGVDVHSSELRTIAHAECRFGYRDSIFKQELKNSFVITAVQLRLNKQPQVNADYKDVRQELEALKINTPSISDIFNAVIAIRRRKLPDPQHIGNAGSFFKNPVVSKQAFEHVVGVLASELNVSVPHYVVSETEVKIPAAWLIEQCGFKGIRRGAVGVHAHQALVVVHYGGGKGSDAYALACDIRNAVEERFAIRLEMEVNII